MEMIHIQFTWRRVLRVSRGWVRNAAPATEPAAAAAWPANKFSVRRSKPI